MMPGHDHESFHLLQISDSVSDSLPDLDLAPLNSQHQHKKKKVRLKRRDRNINTGRQHHHHHGSSGLVKSGDETDDGGGLLSVLAPGPCCVSGHQCLVTLVSVSAVLVALVMVYTITSLNTRVASLEQQLRMKVADDDSKALPEKMQTLESKLDLVVMNQTSVYHRLGILETSLAQLEQRLSDQRDAEISELNQIKTDLELLTKISSTNEESIKDIASIVDSLNLNITTVQTTKKSSNSSQWKTLNNGRP